MRAAIAIAAKDLRQRVRDRSAVVVAVIAPFALAALLSPLYAGSNELDVTFAVADEDHGEVATAFREGAIGSLVEAGIATVVEVASPAEARTLVDNHEADAAFLIPPGFTAAVRSAEPTTLTVIADTDTLSASIAGQIAESAAREFAGQTAAVQLSVAGVLSLAPGQGSDPAELATEAAQISPPVRLVDSEREIKGLKAATFTAAGMSIFFLFFSAQFSFVSLIAERRDGTLARMLASPVRPAAIVAAKLLVGFVIGLTSMAVLVVASALLLGAEWGNPVAVALLVVAAVTASLGVMSFVATFARTEDQANGLGAIVAVTLGIVGGTFFPVWLGPKLLTTLSMLTPHQWWMRGLDDLSLEGAGIGDALPAIAVLLGYGVAFGALALLRARRLVASL